MKAINAPQLWQPIETAPLAQPLLLGYYNKCEQWRTVRGQWFSQEQINDEWEEPDYGEPGWYETSVEAEEPPNCWAITPTHWMPMPPPPDLAQEPHERCVCGHYGPHTHGFCQSPRCECGGFEARKPLGDVAFPRLKTNPQ